MIQLSEIIKVEALAGLSCLQPLMDNLEDPSRQTTKINIVYLQIFIPN
jgi:hypothetical protein